MAPSETPGDLESMIGVPSPLLDIQSRTFATARRGYDRAEVDAFLKRLAETISGLLEERAVLSADSETDLAPEAIAESTAILEDAEARASRRLHAATLEADRLRTEARRTLDKAIKEAQEVENAARANAEQMTAEASEMRQQILRDLLRRRKEAQTHVEMLRAARDELLNVFSQVRRITAQVKDPLDSALDRAKQAADIAAKRTQEEPQESLTQFEAELQTARLSGVIPIPVEAGPAEISDAALTEEGAARLAEAGLTEQGIAQEIESEIAAVEPAEEYAGEQVDEHADGQAGEHDNERNGETLLEPDEPQLENIFARLRESGAPAESHTEPQPESPPATEAASPPEIPEKSSSKKRSGKRAARKKATKKKAAEKPDAETSVPDGLVADDSAADDPVADVQVSDASVSDADSPDAEIEDMKRQIKRALTADESRVLQAIHRLHNKAPKKAEELRKALTNQDDRTEEFARTLSAPAHDIQSLLVSPLAASLSGCDIEEADTKTLIQQVRNAYRSFSQEHIAPAAAELAKHASGN